MPNNPAESQINQPNLDELIYLGKAAGLNGLTTRYLRLLVTNQEIWAKKLDRNWLTYTQVDREYLARN